MTRLHSNQFIGVALLVGALAAVPSCGDRTATGPAPRILSLQGSVGNVAPRPQPTATADRNARRLLRCTPVPPKVVVQKIGPEGGEIVVGPYTLAIPAGALDQEVTIKARIPSRQSVNLVEFQPDRLMFAQPALLTLSYANCDRPDTTQSLQLAAVSDSLDVLYSLPSAVDTVALWVAGKIPFFTNYAVAW